MLGDAGTADDATQQALVTIWRDLPSLRDPNRLGGPSDRTEEIQAHAEAGCVFYVGSGAEADGTPVYYLHGG